MFGRIVTCRVRLLWFLRVSRVVIPSEVALASATLAAGVDLRAAALVSTKRLPYRLFRLIVLAFGVTFLTALYLDQGGFNW